jgi:hypothetical protein
MNDLAGGFAVFYLIFLIVGFFALVLWIFLPFAVFGTKPKLDQILAEARQTNAYLKMLAEQRRPAVPSALPPTQKT